MNPAGPHDPDAVVIAVAGLARELEQQRRRIDDLATLPEEVREVVARVTSLADRLASQPSRPAAPISWLAFAQQHADPGAREVGVAVLSDLIEWMDSVYLRYPDAAQSLPDCWLWHPDVVEELLWVRQAWTAAYAGPAAAVALAGDWHDRQRPGVVSRIKVAAGACSLESHLPGGERDRAPRRVPLVGELGRIAGWWTGSRGERPPHPSGSAGGTDRGTA